MARKFSDLQIASFAVSFIVCVFIFIAFATPYWLRSDPRHYGAEFVRLGLWETCFRSYASPVDLYQSKYYVGCRWIFTFEYQNLRHVLQPPFFVAVQVFFTFGFTLMLAGIVLLLAQQLCLNYDKTIPVLKAISGIFLAAAVCSTIAVIVFGALGDSRHWMPDPDHNFLSWSFGLGVVGTFFEYVAALLFAVEARGQIRKRAARSQQVFSLDQTKA